MSNRVVGSGPRAPGSKWYEVRVRGRVTDAVLSSIGAPVRGWGHTEHGADAPVLVTIRVTDDAHLQGLLEQLLASGLDVLDVTPARSSAGPAERRQEERREHGDEGRRH